MPSPLFFRFSKISADRRSLITHITQLSTDLSAFRMEADSVCPIEVASDVNFLEDKTVRSVPFNELTTIFESADGVAIDFISRENGRTITFNIIEKSNGLAVSLEVEQSAITIPHKMGNGYWVVDFVLKFCKKLKVKCAGCLVTEDFIGKYTSLDIGEFETVVLETPLVDGAILFAAFDEDNVSLENLTESANFQASDCQFGRENSFIFATSFCRD